jgi:DNA-binding SARP family transcriptional activator/tetratricopeptide (TPR) repeat protein
MDWGWPQVRLLGPVDVVVQGVPLPVPGVRRKSVLAVLALHPGVVVSFSRLVDLIWADLPPATAVNTLQRHVSYLRGVLGDRGAIVACSPGYLLDVPGDAIDVTRAVRLVRRGAALSDPARRAAVLREALEIWRGPALSDVTEVAWLRDQAYRLDRLRLDAVESLVEARLALGEHAQLVPELEQLAVEYPFRERFHQQLMLALYRGGRQAEALAAVRRFRETIGAELGLDPGPGLRDLETAILRQDSVLDAPPPASLATTAWTWLVPAQLPHAVPAFAGRMNEMARLDSFLPGAGAAGVKATEATVAVLSGAAGVGKTALAVRWARRVMAQFPDGQLYVNLRGFDPAGPVLEPVTALRVFLDALGVPAQRIPVTSEAQVGLYRSVLAGRRVLIVADNARDEEQVRPLLPGTAGCLVLVTSRTRLPGLVAAEGARTVPLDLPSVAEARDMLTERLGVARTAAEPGAIDQLINACARLPLALAVVAARAELDPTLPLTALAAQLRGTPSTLDAFDSGDPATDVRGVFSWSYRVLSGPAARLFRLLGRCPGPDVSPALAASVAGLPPAEVRPLLAELIRAHLLTEPRPGRIGFHELLRAYAMELSDRYDSPAEQAVVRHRFLDHLLHTAEAGATLITPSRDPLDLAAPLDGVRPEAFPDRDRTLAWFADEHPLLLATMAREPDGFDRHTWQLGWALYCACYARGYWRDNHQIQQSALHAAQRIDDRNGQAHSHRSLSNVYIDLGQLADAERHNRAALDLFEQVGDSAAAAGRYLNLGLIAERRAGPHEAIRHTERAYDLYSATGHRTGQAHALNNLGDLYRRLGDHQTALDHCRQALAILAQPRDHRILVAIWDSLGMLYFDSGDRDRAWACFRRAIMLCRRAGDRFTEASTYVNLGDCHDRAGNPFEAQRAWRRALTTLNELGDDAAAQLRRQLQARPASGPGRTNGTGAAGPAGPRRRRPMSRGFRVPHR